MELTGRCEQEFKKWYLTWIFKEKTYLSLNFSEQQILENWKSLHDSEKYGVLVDYFDSVGININIVSTGEPTMSGFKFFGYRVIINGFKKNLKFLETRQEARTKAIEKANELRNQQLNK